MTIDLALAIAQADLSSAEPDFEGDLVQPAAESVGCDFAAFHDSSAFATSGAVSK